MRNAVPLYAARNAVPLVYIYKNQNVCTYICNASVTLGGLLLRNGAGYGGGILGASRTRASVCCIKFWKRCARWFARGGRIFAAFWAAAGAEQTARALGSVSSLRKVTFLSAINNFHLKNR